jgi:hypothetical protein
MRRRGAQNESNFDPAVKESLVEAPAAPVIATVLARADATEHKAASDDVKTAKLAESAADFKLPWICPSAVIDDFLYLGARFSAEGKEGLQALGVTRILNCCSSTNLFPKDFEYLTHPLRDSSNQECLSIFKSCVDFIGAHNSRLSLAHWPLFVDKAKETKTGVLVHCQVHCASRAAM